MPLSMCLEEINETLLMTSYSFLIGHNVFLPLDMSVVYIVYHFKLSFIVFEVVLERTA